MNTSEKDKQYGWVFTPPKQRENPWQNDDGSPHCYTSEKTQRLLDKMEEKKRASVKGLQKVIIIFILMLLFIVFAWIATFPLEQSQEIYSAGKDTSGKSGEAFFHHRYRH